MKVLVIGSGGREHAIVQACLNSDLVTEVIAAPGNGGMAAQVKCLPVDVNSPEAITALALEQHAQFVIVGPEAPLAAGAVDALEAKGIPAYGPRKAGARLEASKSYSKDFLKRHNIPTATGESFRDYSKALCYLREHSYPLVIKADGLAAGKGVIICENFEQAEHAAQDMLVKNDFGTAGHEIIVEEFMTGEEASIMLMVSGEQYLMLPPSQDHKRIGEGDTGPNTGGMGAYAPADVVTPAVEAKVRKEIIEPTLAGLKAEGIDYRGTLYVGIMVTPGGQPKVVEFNVRFGDPECQILLPLLQQDPVQLMLDCAKGTLKPTALAIKDESAIIVVLAAEGYPSGYRKGDPITFPAELPQGVQIIHAGTKLATDNNGKQQIVTAGGRVLGVVATAPTLKAARDKAYAVADQVQWQGVTMRRDIAWRQLQRRS